MRKFKARSGGVGAASPGARERVSRSWTPLRLTRNRVATCRLEPSRFSLVCTTRRRQSRAEGRRDSSVQGGFPSASLVVHASANRYPSTPRRAPDRRLPARPWRPGARGGATCQAAHLVCVTLPGVPASHGQPQSSEEGEPCRD